MGRLEPDDEKPHVRLRATITEFLIRVWKDGALVGTKPEQAFFYEMRSNNHDTG
jgi:hypothetical protein